MKKMISLITILVCVLCSSLRTEASGFCWYMKRVKGDCPIFPNNSEYVFKHSAYALDKSAYENGEKVIYLTFDSGYENGNTAKILDTLKDKSVPATFFILKLMIEKEGALVKRMVDEGHIVANHTKNHKDMTTLTNEEMRLNLSALEELCLDEIGYEMPKFFRFPEGRFDNRTLENAEALGYSTFFWSLAYADWDNGKQPSCESAIKTLLDYTHPGAIVLLHPTSSTNAEILPELIDAWRALGYRFGSLDELIERNKAVV